MGRLHLIASAGFRVPIADVVLLVVAVALGLIALRYRAGRFWKDTAEERGARITELERHVADQATRIYTLEAEVAGLKSRPDLRSLADLMREHDRVAGDQHERVAEVLDRIVGVLARIGAVVAPQGAST